MAYTTDPHSDMELKNTNTATHTLALIGEIIFGGIWLMPALRAIQLYKLSEDVFFLLIEYMKA